MEVRSWPKDGFLGFGCSNFLIKFPASSIEGDILSGTFVGSLQKFLRESRQRNGTAPTMTLYIIHPSAQRSMALVYSEVSASRSGT